jgi:hypothetical protein
MEEVERAVSEQLLHLPCCPCQVGSCSNASTEQVKIPNSPILAATACVLVFREGETMNVILKENLGQMEEPMPSRGKHTWVSARKCTGEVRECKVDVSERTAAIKRRVWGKTLAMIRTGKEVHYR